MPMEVCPPVPYLFRPPQASCSRLFPPVPTCSHLPRPPQASYNGVLGGFGYVSDTDVHDSTQLVEKAMRGQLEEAKKGSRTLVALGERQLVAVGWQLIFGGWGWGLA
jgi:hypothetical protein